MRLDLLYMYVMTYGIILLYDNAEQHKKKRQRTFNYHCHTREAITTRYLHVVEAPLPIFRVAPEDVEAPHLLPQAPHLWLLPQ